MFSSMPPRMRRGLCSTSRPCSSDADWCLQFDDMPKFTSAGTMADLKADRTKAERALYQTTSKAKVGGGVCVWGGGGVKGQGVAGLARSRH